MKRHIESCDLFNWICRHFAACYEARRPMDCVAAGDLLTDTSFNTKLFNRYIKGFADYRDVTTRNTWELNTDNEFTRLLISYRKAK